MDEYVSRGYLLNEYDRQHQGPPGGARKIIVDAPAADVRPVRRGKWMPHKIDAKNESIDEDTCSCCGERFYQIAETGCRWNYCPNCGADMRKQEAKQDPTPDPKSTFYDLLYEEGGANTT